MNEEKVYLALFVKEVEKRNEPIFLTTTPTVRVTGKPIFTPSGEGKFSYIEGKTKRAVQQKISRLKKENKLLWGINHMNIPENAEIIIVLVPVQ
ncbi:MAG: hypothetical protein ABIJ17_02920 [Patescibacteria group bacterium]